MQSELSAQWHPGKCSCFSVTGETWGGVWEWTAGNSSLSESSPSKWAAQVIMAWFGSWNLSVTAPSAEAVEGQNRMGQIWAAPPHTLVTFSKLLGLLVHLQEINGLLWTSMARVCWNWESETVRLLMEVFGRIQDTCKKNHSEVYKAQILIYQGMDLQSFKLADKDLSRAENLAWGNKAFQEAGKGKLLFCSTGALCHPNVKEAEHFSLCWCWRSKKDNLLSF